jgi:antirestriction protein ArdC
MATATKASRKRKTEGPTPEEKLVAGLIELLEAGVNPWQRDWRGTSLGQHRNLISGEPYHGGNPALLEMQLAMRGSELPLWAGHGQAKSKGWYPRKGSRGCYIVRPQLNRYEELDEGGKPVLNEQGEAQLRQWTSFKPVCVFNAADLEGEGLAEAIAAAIGTPEQRQEPEILQQAEAVLGAWCVPVTYGGNSAFYSPMADRITLPPRHQFLSGPGFYATWAHEAVHSTGHGDRLARDGIVHFAGRASESYAKEELIAELGAFLLGVRLEIGSAVENHAAYLGSWIAALKAQPKTLLQSLSAATKAANLIHPETITPAPAGEDQ